jgi:uncharacterized protein (DUF58 family)
LLVLLGLVWLGPAFADSRFLYGMVAWDALVFLAWAIDLARLPSARQLSITRKWQSPAALSVPGEVELTLQNDSRIFLHASLMDNVPVVLSEQAPEMNVSVPPKSENSGQYRILPVRRGNVAMDSVYIRYQSAWRIAERWGMAELKQKICVYPNLREAQRHSVYLMRSRQIDIEKRYTRIRGAGREFESLREYREGDEFRDICWSASARRGKAVTRQYQVERSQTIWLVLDCGRLMRTRVEGLTKLDYAVNAALSLGQVALGSGDRVGLLAYGRKVRQRILPYRGSAHLRKIIEQLAMIEEETAEADHLQAAGVLLSSQSRRSLIVWITDLAETAMTPEVVEAVSQMMSRHLVVFAVIGQPDLEELATREPESVPEMYLTTAAQEVRYRRELLVAKLRRRGALAVEVNSNTVATVLVNSYLEVKERSLL